VWNVGSVSSSSSSSQLQPIATMAVPAGDLQTCITFHPHDAAELMTNGARRVFFWQHQAAAEQLSYYSPPFRPAEFQQTVGDFVASTFVPGTSQASCRNRACLPGITS